MAVGTNVRAGRLWRTLIAAQSAKGTPVNDLTNASQLWTSRAGADIAAAYDDPTWWMSFKNDYKNARHAPATLARDNMVAMATPTMTSLALQSLFGTLSGSTFTQTGYVAKWLTLGFVEDKSRVNVAHRLMRAYDAMIHKMTWSVDANGSVELTCDYAAESSDHARLDDLASISATLPSAPMNSVDLDVFPGRSVAFTREASGAVPFERLSITLDANLGAEWDFCGQKERAKKWGPLVAKVVAQGRASDEYWQLMDDADDDTKTTYRVTMTGPNGHTLTMRFFNLVFNVSSMTLNDQNYESVVAEGMATQDLSDNFVSITLT